jgi:predicted CXXCH cytochrome family protein
MKLLIRYLKKQGQSYVSKEVLVESDTLLIGRGTNQHILLPDPRVALEHAKLSTHADGCKINTASGKDVLFNGLMVKNCVIAAGDVIEISGHKITLLAGEKGCDFVVQVKLSTAKQEPLQNRYRVKFTDLNLYNRTWSWFLFLLVLIACLVLPLSGDCSQCHKKAFEPTNNQACLTCHNSIQQHVAKMNVTPDFVPLSQCSSCHKEHNSKETLSDYSQQFCVTCHKKTSQDKVNNVEYGSATDFEHHHPAFSVTMLKPVLEYKKTKAWSRQRQLLNRPEIVEQSNLNFSHQLHMAPEGIQSATGEVKLACINCHEPALNGLEMKPISMEKNCQSCHQLTFDPDDPKRVVPHGSPTEVVLMMREYYAFRFIYQNLKNDVDKSAVKAGELFTVRNARRPGRDERLRKNFEQSLNSQTFAAIEKLTKQTVRTEALVWAESRANQAANDIFERQACNICHVVTKDDTEQVPWQVEPVVLTQKWLPKADFTHGGHKTMACVDCHQADNSDLSSDVLIPDIENCQQCHGGLESKNLIPNTCIDCHDFHQAKDHIFLQLTHVNKGIKSLEPITNAH